jgi:hypothetical protein
MKIVSLDELYTWLPLPQTSAEQDFKEEQARNTTRVAQGLKPFTSHYAEVSDELYAKLEQALTLIREVSDVIEGEEI